MKYLVIIMLSFFLATPALAAKVVPKSVPQGTVPEVQPLQPPPAGISPGYNKNIQSQGAQIENGSWGGDASLSPAAQHAGPNILPNPIAKPGNWPVWLAALLAAAIFGWVLYKKNKRE